MKLFEPGSFEIVPHDGMRRIIGTRLLQAKQTIPHFYLTVDCALDTLLEARATLNEHAPTDKDGNPAWKLSVNDFLIKALGLALKRVPDANVTWTENALLKHARADVGVAVAIEGGLFTPVIRNADQKSLSQISQEMKELAGKARKRRLAPHEYQGGTTALSNLGMFGVKNFDAVINPPHATILAVGAGEKRPVVVGDAVVIRTDDDGDAVLRSPRRRRCARGAFSRCLQGAGGATPVDGGLNDDRKGGTNRVSGWEKCRA